MCAPSPPPSPDYAAAATAQGPANREAALQGGYLSNPNVISPYGNQTVNFASPDPNNPDYKQATVTQTLTPDAQAALTAQQHTQAALGGLAQQGIGQAQDILGKPFQFSGPTISAQAPTSGALDLGPTSGLYGQAGSVDPSAYGQAGSLNAGMYGLANGKLDLSGVAKAPINAGTTAQQAIMSRLQPQIEQNSKALANQLANQGITQGGEAYNNAMRTQGEQQNDLYSQAALQGLNLDMSANQQGYNQALSSAGLYNSAVGQNYGQGLQSQQLQNQAIGQNFGQAVTAQQMQNQAIGQNYGQAQTSASSLNASRAQQYNQDLQSAGFTNNASNQALAQQLALYNQPLNSITALMSGSQIQNPQFQQYSGQNVAAAPVFGAAQAQGQYDQNVYAQQVAASNAATSGLFDLAGAGLKTFGPALLKSDRRLKSNVVKLADHPKGFGVYAYDIDGKREIGVMAQEVERIIPQAVHEHPDGYKMVNYGLVLAA